MTGHRIPPPWRVIEHTPAGRPSAGSTSVTIRRAAACPKQKKAIPVALIEYEIELERTNGKTDHTSAALPSLTKGQRLKVRVDGEAVDAEVIEATLVRRTAEMEIARCGGRRAYLAPSGLRARRPAWLRPRLSVGFFPHRVLVSRAAVVLAVSKSDTQFILGSPDHTTSATIAQRSP
jgi:hypothetical protein